MIIAAVVQCTADDLSGSTDPSDYCIAECLASPLFDKIILACPATAASIDLVKLSEEWGVEIFLGDELDVAARLLAAAMSVGATIIVRLLLRQFYVDLQQVGRMVEKIQRTSAEYISLPYDYNYSLAADVFTTAALQKAVSYIDEIANNRERCSMQFSPAVFIEDHPELFEIREIDAGEDYSPQTANAIREKFSRLIGENQVHFKWDFPASSYAFAGKYLHDDWTVLDIACGKGQGVRCLKSYCAAVVGVDLSQEHIDIAVKQQEICSGGISFEVGSAETFLRPGQFSAVVSLHTLEHLVDPDAFLCCSHANLQEKGRLFLEVPLFLEHPLLMPLMPWHDKEYGLQELVDLVLRHDFWIDEVWAKSRHAFVKISLDGEEIVPCKKRLTAGIIVATKGETVKSMCGESR